MDLGLYLGLLLMLTTVLDSSCEILESSIKMQSLGMLE